MLIRNFLLHTEKMKRLSVALLEQVSGQFEILQQRSASILFLYFFI